MALTVVLSNDYNYYADGEVVTLDPPLPDGSVGAEHSSLIATMEDYADRGRVSTVGPFQVLGLRYQPPVTPATSGVARTDFRYVPLGEDADDRDEGPPLLFVDVAATLGATERSGYGFAILSRSTAGPSEMMFDNGGFSNADEIEFTETHTFDRPSVLDWYTAQIEWTDTDVTFSILYEGAVVQSWSSTIHPTRAPLQHLRTGGYYVGASSTVGGPVQVEADNAYLAVDVGDVPPPVAEPVTRIYPRKDNLGPAGSAPRLGGNIPTGRIYPRHN